MQIGRSGVKLHLGREVTPKLIADLDFDLAVMATGSVPFVPEIPGIKEEMVVSCSQVLSGKKEVGGKVLIMGGGMEGCETAVWLSQKGKNVRIVELLDSIATNIHQANRQMLLDMMDDLNIEIIQKGKIIKVNKNGVSLMHETKSRFLECDFLILAAGLTPFRSLSGPLKEKGKQPI